jgi:hypothetical protein
MKISAKKILILSLSTFAVFFLLLAVSCNKNLCKDVVCAYDGVCNGGACTCQLGYEGSNCETRTRDKYLGNWTVYEKGSITNAAQYQVSVGAANNVTQVYIYNFNNYFTALIIANVSGDTITIPNQQYDGKVVFGSGYIYTSTTYGQYGSMLISYEVVDTATLLVDDYGYYSSSDLSQPSAWNK